MSRIGKQRHRPDRKTVAGLNRNISGVECDTDGKGLAEIGRRVAVTMPVMGSMIMPVM